MCAEVPCPGSSGVLDSLWCNLSLILGAFYPTNWCLMKKTGKIFSGSTHNLSGRKSNSSTGNNEPRIAIWGIWGDTWLNRGKYGIYVAVRGSWRGPLRGVSHVSPQIPKMAIRGSYEAALRNGSDHGHYGIKRTRTHTVARAVYASAVLYSVSPVTSSVGHLIRWHRDEGDQSTSPYTCGRVFDK